MHHIRSLRVEIPLLLSLLTIIAGSPLSAQPVLKKAKIASFTLALSPVLPQPGGRAVVIRHASRNSAVIVLPSNGATIGDVIGAIALLMSAEANDDRSRDNLEQRIPITSTIAMEDFPPDLAVKFEKLLQELGAAPIRMIKGLGRVQAMEVPTARFNVFQAN